MARLIETITEYREQPDCRTAAQMELICCEEAPALVCCEIARPWDGYSVLELQEMHNVTVDEQGRDSEGRYVYWEFLDRENPCGEEVIDYDLTPGNCCDDVEPIVIDTESTPDILKARFTVNVYWDGGRPPFTVKTSNPQTYFFANDRREIVTAASWVQITALESFCGATVVTISDGCSARAWVLRSDQGKWELTGQACIFPNATDWDAGGSSNSETRTKISGMWKQTEQIRWRFWDAAGFYCPSAGSFWGDDPGPGNPADRCLPNCGTALAVAVDSVRGAGDIHSTCMYANAATNRGLTEYHRLADGASVTTHPVYATTFSCSYAGMGGSGAAPMWIGAYYKTASLYAYKWVC